MLEWTYVSLLTWSAIGFLTILVLPHPKTGVGSLLKITLGGPLVWLSILMIWGSSLGK
jgi:hypothetical protein